VTLAEVQVSKCNIPPEDSRDRAITRRLRLRGALPGAFDRRTNNAVQIEKDQGKCGSCEAFGAIAAQESARAINFKQLYSLSEQNVLHCVALIVPPGAQ
jgi:C1A family cysteine protease